MLQVSCEAFPHFDPPSNSACFSPPSSSSSPALLHSDPVVLTIAVLLAAQQIDTQEAFVPPVVVRLFNPVSGVSESPPSASDSQMGQALERLADGGEGPAPPARLYFAPPPSAGGDELAPLAAQVISARRGEEDGRRQLSRPEGQLISSKVWEIYDPPQNKAVSAGGTRKHKSGRSGSGRVRSAPRSWRWPVLCRPVAD